MVLLSVATVVVLTEDTVLLETPLEEEAVVSLVSLPVILLMVMALQLSLLDLAVVADTDKAVLAEVKLATTEALVVTEAAKQPVALELRELMEHT